MAIVVDLKGRKYEVGTVYLEGTVLKLMRHGSPLILDTEISSDELDVAVTDCGRVRIYTSPMRRKQK